MAETLGLTPLGWKLLHHFQVARRADRDLPEEWIEKRSAIEELVRLGVLGLVPETFQSTGYWANFEDWKSHRGMLRDQVRTYAFETAIKALVSEGDSVVDVGSGSGILALMAARAGAGRVYALELTNIIDDAIQIAAENGIATVEFLRGDGARFRTDRSVDVIVSEFAGMFLIDEWRHFAAFTHVRNTNLKPAGKVIPCGGDISLSAIDSRKLYNTQGFGLWEAKPYGFDFSHALEASLKKPQREIVYQLDCASIVDTQKVASFDFSKDDVSSYFFDKQITLTYPVHGSCHGFVGHFRLEMTPGEFLNTSPFAAPTHWHQSYFPIRSFPVRQGEQISLRVRTFISEKSNELCLGLTVLEPNAGQSGELVYGLET